MRKFVRRNAPTLLEENWERWGKEYASKRNSNPGHLFRWPHINKQPLNQVLLPFLKAQTDNHCSYCDKSPLFRGDESIDHFRPKTDKRFYEEVCQWNNLYLACKHCQDSKMALYNEHLLRPDDIHYHFLKYFIYNYNEHQIDPNPLASDEETHMARETIKVFDLNHPSMKISRRHAYERYTQAKDPVLEDYNFRFIFE